MSGPIDQDDLIGCLKVGAYYYGFDPTEVPAVDRILGAVCRAGKMYHHTDMWTGDLYTQYRQRQPMDPPTPVDVIQTTANEAAAEIIELRRKLAIAADIAKACPFGYVDGQVITSRRTSQADIIAWLQRLDDLKRP